VSGAITLEIDCLATARRVLSAPEAVYSATPFEIVAMAACTVRESTGELPALPVIADRPQVSASLAAAVARLLRADAATMEVDDLGVQQADSEYHAAFAALQTTFEKEFPNGSDL